MANMSLTPEEYKLYTKALEDNNRAILFFQLRNKWDVSLAAREIATKFFLRMLTRENFLRRVMRPDLASSKCYFWWDSEAWELRYDHVHTSDLATAEHVGLSFRILPSGQRIVIAKIWKARKQHG